MKKLTMITLLTLISLSLSITAETPPRQITVPLTFDAYYSYAEVVEALKALHKAYPELTKLDVIGQSDEGRDIYAITINNPKTGPELDKPAVYADGNIHGNEIQAGEVALYMLNYLLTKYGENEDVTEMVDRNVFYVVPIVNVDGRYHFFADPNTDSSNRSVRLPKDDDRDGLVDEDFPDDLDGDGNICMVRKRDPLGNLKTDPEDPRLMVPVKPGELGEWTLLGVEGIDNDGDGRVNEDSEGFVDGNRNWGFDWMPQYVQFGSGDYPFESLSIRSVANYFSERPNICVAYSMHNSGGMYLRGPSQKGLGEYPRQDIAVYDYLGKQAERMVPGYNYMIGWKDLYTTYGDAVEWMVGCNGAYGYVIELFQVASETFKSREEERRAKPLGVEGELPFNQSNEFERERLKYSDNLVMGELFKPWKPYKHPLYGDVEIGGWVKFSTRMPAKWMLKDEVHRNAMAIIFAARHTPDVTLDVFEVKEVGKNLYRVRTRLQNRKAIPTMSTFAQQKKMYPKDMLKVSGSNAEVVAGGTLNDVYRDFASYKEYRPELQFVVIPGFGRVEHQFLVSGKGSITITYEGRWATDIKKTVELKDTD
jgi:hypothetical protein